jgi:hypothetical protein
MAINSFPLVVIHFKVSTFLLNFWLISGVCSSQIAMLQPNQYKKLSPLWLNKCLKNKGVGGWKTCPRIKTSPVREPEVRTPLR